MKKRLISLIILGIISFSLVGCKNNSNGVITNKANRGMNNGYADRFVSIGDFYKIGNVGYQTFYDSKTNIVYIADAEYHQTGITVMYDTEGNPMTLAKYNKTK